MVLVLSCMPCMDEVDAAESKTTIEISTTTNQQEHSDEDNCSPFCTCSCCASCVFISHSVLLTQIILSATEKKADHLPAAISEISLPVWQPPKLS